VSSFVEFGPLVKAAKDQKVPIKLKSAVIKALDILISNNPTLSIGMVKTTKQFLENDIRSPGNVPLNWACRLKIGGAASQLEPPYFLRLNRQSLVSSNAFEPLKKSTQ